jgi:hypothetical protein
MLLEEVLDCLGKCLKRTPWFAALYEREQRAIEWDQQCVLTALLKIDF